MTACTTEDVISGATYCPETYVLDGICSGSPDLFHVRPLPAMYEESASHRADLTTTYFFGVGCAAYGLWSTVYDSVIGVICRIPDVSEW